MTTTRTLTPAPATSSLSHANLADWPQWQSPEFASMLNNELMNLPNNAQLIFTVTVLLLQLVTLAISSNKLALPLTQQHDARAMVRSCIIKMRYSHLKTCDVVDQASLWDHLLADKTATRVWCDAFDSLRQELAKALPTGTPNMIDIDLDTISGLDTVFRGDEDYVDLIMNTRIKPSPKSSRLTRFETQTGAVHAERLQSALDLVSIECNTQLSSRSVKENSMAWLAFQCDSLLVKPDEVVSEDDRKGEL